MAMSKTQKGWTIAGLIALVLFILWWIFGRESDKETLKEGDKVYKRNGKYYLSPVGTKDSIAINKDEYEYLIAKDSGDCVKPPESNPQRLIKNLNNARNTGDRCNYYGYVGVVNDCGTCSLWRNFGGKPEVACGPMGQSAECVTGNSPYGQTENNGYMDVKGCLPCNQSPAY